MSVDPVPAGGGWTLYRPPAEWDLAVRPDVLHELDELLEDRPWLAVDLSALEFIDSSGLGDLIWARNQATDRGGDVVLVGAPDRVLRLLELTQLDQVFPLYSDVDDLPAQDPVVRSDGTA
jgi:anti-anti-sigma factor